MLLELEAGADVIDMDVVVLVRVPRNEVVEVVDDDVDETWLLLEDVGAGPQVKHWKL